MPTRFDPTAVLRTLVVLCLLSTGCSEKSTVQLPSSWESPQNEPICLMGFVLAPNGRPIDHATVVMDCSPAEPKYLAAETNERGFFVMSGPALPSSPCPLWAVSAGGRVGNVWVSESSALASVPEALRTQLPPTSSPTCGFAVVSLRAGTTTLHVRDANCRPVVDARVTVVEGSLDDITVNVPPPVQRLLTVHTNSEGIAFFNGTLADTALGFEIKAPGFDLQQDRSFFGPSNDDPKLFVLNGDSETRLECQEVIRKEINAKRNREAPERD